MVDPLNLPPLNPAEILRSHGLRPDKRLGQNFLVDESALQRIVQAAEVGPQDNVLEIGPGLGALTRHLAARAARVTAVELDERLFPALREVVGASPNVRLVQGDILHFVPRDLMGGEPYLVAANIPYYITSAVFRHLLSAAPLPRRVVLTVQREVAGRVCAAPGKMNLLALSVQVYGAPRIAAHIPAEAFYPVPKVDSAVVRVDVFPRPRIPAAHLDAFFRLARAAFSQKRKTLLNALSAGMRWGKPHTRACLERAGIEPQLRAQALGWDEWEALVSAVEEL